MKIPHGRFFTHALRTGLLFVIGFSIYEILLYLEKKWSLENPEHASYFFYQRKIYKLISLFIVDLIILYSMAIFFGVVM